MTRSVSSRLVASLLAGVLAFAGLTVSTPAMAAEDPISITEETPSPEVTEGSDPDDGAVVEEPAEEPAAEPTEAPAEEPAGESAPESTPAADAATESVVYTGRIQRVADRELDEVAAASTQLFTVTDLGQLRVDVSGLDLGRDTFGVLTLRFAVPAGLELPEGDAASFQVLTEASIASPLVATERLTKVSGRGTSALVNQTPANAAVHKIFAVLVTPSNVPLTAVHASQTAAKVQTAVTSANTYWNAQSSGVVQFALAGTTSWYKSGYSCATDAGSTQLWTQAASIAATQLGYQAAKNTHLALFFPSTADCGGAIGLGTVGWTANEGGLLWSIGTDAPIEQATLKHELGHNLSLGHATWLDCAGSNPNPGFMGAGGICDAKSYGDVVDVMGFGLNGKDGGALSSPSAIRSGLWPASAYEAAGGGTTTHTLNAVSSNSGKRAVIVEDTNGVNYFVEFRNFTDEDAQFAGLGCNADYCTSAQPEVRIMRLEQQVLSGYYFKGFPGDDSFVVGRSPWDGDRVGYRAGESFSASGISITVSSISATTATVSVYKPDTLVRGSYVTAVPVAQADASMRVGDTWSALLEADWTATSYTYQWYRWVGGAAGSLQSIPGATSQNYTVGPADLGNYISVKVTGVGSGAPRTAQDPPAEYYGYGPMLAGPLMTGAVTIDATAYPFKAVTAGWQSGATFKYQWYRNGAVISGATSATYTPTATDRGKLLSVRATGARAGYVSASVTSDATDYTLYADGVFAISGTPQVGKTVTASTLTYTKNLPSAGTPVTPVVTYQWYRAGVAIAGATSVGYALTTLDYGKAITVTATASAPGTIKHAINVALAGTIAKGTIQGSLAAPTVATSGTSVLKLTAALPVGAITEPGVAYAYQWLRAGAVITGATLSSYTLTAADFNKAVSVRVTVTKSNYVSVVSTSTAKNYSIIASGSPVIGGVLKVGRTLQVAEPTYTIDTGAVGPVLTYQWYRTGVAIPGATGSSYALVAADYTKTITVTVTAHVSGYQSIAKASVATAAIGYGVIQGTRAVPVVTQSGTTLASVLPDGSLTEPGTTVKIQWYRSGVAVVGKTAATYVLSSLDFGKTVQVRYSVAKSGYTAYTVASTAPNYSLVASALPKITGVPVVGQQLQVTLPTYTFLGSAVTPTSLAYQWYRSGVAIPGPLGTGPTYTLVTADRTKAITVRVTPAYAGPVTAVAAAATSAATAVIVGNQFVVTGLPVVTMPTPANLTLTVTAANRGVTVPSGAVVTYQWYRGTAAIAGATTASYKLVAADAASAIKVRVTVTKADFLTVAQVSTPDTYGLAAGSAIAISDGGDEVLRVGDTLTASYTPGTTDGNGDPATRTVAYQWYRAGVAVAGKTTGTYVLTSADLGKVISFRAAESLVGWLPVATTKATPAILAGVIPGTREVPVVTQSGTGGLTLTAALPTGSVDGTGHVVTWQWYRGATAVVGKTTATYVLTSADAASTVWVKATVAKTGYTSFALSSQTTGYGVLASPAIPVITGTVASGETLSVGARSYALNGVDITAGVTPAYQWYRAGVAVTGQTAASYTLSAADIGKAITVRVAVAAPNALGNAATSAATIAVGAAAFTNADPIVITKPVTKLTVTSTGVTLPAGAVVAYQWYRGATAVVGQTTSGYQLGSADLNQTVRVRITVSKAGFTTLVKFSDPVNYTVSGATPTISGTIAVGSTLTASVAGGFTLQGAPITPTVTAYQWYRAGIAITGATSATYTLTSLDLAKAVTVKVGASSTGFLSYGKLSAATVAVAKGTFTGTLTGPQIISLAPNVVTAELPAGSIAEPSATITYQWYRGAAAIAGATKATYTLVAADSSTLLQVRATVAKAGYTSKVLSSATRSSNIVPSSALVVTGAATVGQSLTVAVPAYTTALGAGIEPDVSIQWYRNGVAVAAATDDYYWLTSADFGRTVSVKVTAQFAGLITLAQAWATPEPVAIATIAGSRTVPVISGVTTWTASLPVGSITEEDVTFGWVWLRDGAIVAGAVGPVYTPTAPGSYVARVTVTKPGFAPVVLTSAPVVPAP